MGHRAVRRQRWRVVGDRRDALQLCHYVGDHGDDGGADPHRLGRGAGKALQEVRGDDEHVGADAATRWQEGLNCLMDHD